MKGGGGERWLFESDGIAGCGKTSAAYTAARALGCANFDALKLDSRSTTVADLRALEGSMQVYGFGPTGRKAYIIDEIHHLSRDCLRMLLGLLESLPSHVIVIGTTTSSTWADEVDGLFSRFRRFIFRKPNAKAVAEHLERIASEVEGLTVPEGFHFSGMSRARCAIRRWTETTFEPRSTGYRMHCGASVVWRWRLERGGEPSMSIANRLFGRREHRVTAERQNADAIAAELKNHPPLTIVGRLFADRTIGVGVRLDTSICLRPDGKESGP